MRDAVFVTGGSKGIGAATVRAALERGWDVAFSYHSGEDAARSIVDDAARRAPGARCRAYRLDLLSADEIESVCDTVSADFEALKAVVCNAATDRPGTAAFTTDEDWRAVIDANLTGHFFVMRHFLSVFVPNGYGRFVTLSSLAQDGSSGQAAYAASKGALTALAKSIGKEYACKGITSNVVLPGAIDTSMIGDDPKGLVDYFQRFGPSRRLGTPEEVAEAVLFLCSSGSGYVNCAVMNVSGGIDWVH